MKSISGLFMFFLLPSPVFLMTVGEMGYICGLFSHRLGRGQRAFGVITARPSAWKCADISALHFEPAGLEEDEEDAAVTIQKKLGLHRLYQVHLPSEGHLLST